MNPNDDTALQDDLSELPEGTELKLRPRPKSTVTITLPTDALRSVEEIALRKETTTEALLRFYISQGLRDDLAEAFAQQVLEKTAAVLERHHLPSEEVSGILSEIRREVTSANR